MVNEDSLQQLIRPIVTSMDYDYVGLEYISLNKGSILRIYIDKTGGIDVEDCAIVSRQISSMLDIEDPISGEYNLEVSSPGLDRPLFTKEHYQQFIGKEVKMHLIHPLAGSNRKKYKGIIFEVNEEQGSGTSISLNVDNEVVDIPLSQIKKSNLVVQF